MLVLYPGENFVELNLGVKKRLRYAVSNFGRLISYKERFTDGTLLKPNVPIIYEFLGTKCLKNVVQGIFTNM